MKVNCKLHCRNGHYKTSSTVLARGTCLPCKRNRFKNWRLMKAYGITLAMYNLMMVEQKSRCAVCLTHQMDLLKPLAVDHDHKTATVRGLLCDRCNVALGMVRDNEGILKTLVRYLNEPRRTTQSGYTTGVAVRATFVHEVASPA